MHRHPRGRLWPWRGSQNGKTATSQSLSKVVDRNIQVIDEYRVEVEQQKTFQDHIADWITAWTGSMLFVYFHVAWFAIWILANVNVFGFDAFDPYPFGLLTTIVSLEAIFLSTFVLVSQNRQAGIADRRSEFDLQINLLSEYEMTRVLTLVDAIAKKLGCEAPDEREISELKEDVKPKELLQELDARANNGGAATG